MTWMAEFVESNADTEDFCLNLCIKAQQKDSLAKVLISLWMIWFNKNSCLHDSKCYTSVQLVKQIDAVVKDYEEGMASVHGERIIAKQAYHERCIPPAAGFLKLNCDAAYNAHSGTASLGFVIRNGMGDVVLGGISKVAGVESVLHAECMAIVYGMESAWQKGYSEILVEFDSKVAIEEIGRGKDSLWMGAALIHDILALSL